MAENTKEFRGEIELVKLGANDQTILYQNTDQVPTQDGYVQYGKDDEQFNYLLEMYVNSPTHNAIINSVSFMTFGQGLNDPSVINPYDLKNIIKDWNVFGNAAIQVTKDGSLYHMPVNFLRAMEIPEGEVNVKWFKFSTDFKDGKSTTLFPAWSEDWIPTEEHPIAIYYIKTYTPNAFYYGIPSFQSGLNFCQQEIQVANFITNYIRNNFSVTVLVNFNNGTSDPAARKANKAAIKKKYTGVDGDTVIVAHNKSKEYAATIETVSVPNASEQYEYVSKNARQQIIVAHQIVSPLLVGVRDEGGTGLSSNANELIESRILLEEMKIAPNQELIADALNEIKGTDTIEFISSAPMRLEQQPTEELPQPEPVSLKKANPVLQAFIDAGEEKIEGYELLASTIKTTGLHNDIVEVCENYFNKYPTQFARTPRAAPNRPSSEDRKGYLVRYRYGGVKTGERAFCVAMLGANKLYRKEDIIAAGKTNINPGFGMRPFPNKPYSIWKYQGGGLLSKDWKFGTCKHHWVMEVYVAEETNSKTRVELGRQINIATAIRNGISPLQNPVEVHTSNWDMSRNRK